MVQCSKPWWCGVARRAGAVLRLDISLIIVLSWPAQPPPWYCRQYVGPSSTHNTTQHSVWLGDTITTNTTTITTHSTLNTEEQYLTDSDQTSVSPPAVSLEFSTEIHNQRGEVWLCCLETGEERPCPLARCLLSLLSLVEPGVRRRWRATLVPTVLPVLDDNMKNDETLPDSLIVIYCWYWSGGRYSHWAAEGDVWQGQRGALMEHHHLSHQHKLSRRTGTILQAKLSRVRDRAGRWSGMFVSGCFNSVSRWKTREY